jgi:hypothetical protein
MRLEKKTTLLVFLIFIGTITAFATLQHQKPTRQPQAVTEADPRPIVDYVSSTHDKNEPKRHSRGKRYDGGAVQGTGTQDGLVTFFDDWDFNVSVIPAGMSDAVVAGTVTDSKAYLSPDGTGVYSEFTLKVEKVLKDRSGTISTTAPLAIDRAGGRVRYPSGDIVKYIVSGQGMPRVNKRYVFFLKLEDQDFRILTGYELGAGGVSPLDMTVEKFKKYKGVDEATFLNQIRNAINSGSDTSGMR